MNFVRALRASRKNYYVVGSDYNRYYLQLPDVAKRFPTPRHDDPRFVGRVAEIATRERVDFIHPQPSSEAMVLASTRRRLPAITFLPPRRVMELAQDKLKTQSRLRRARIPVAATRIAGTDDSIYSAFEELGKPVWIRARHGAGGRLSLLCQTSDEAAAWIALWERKGESRDEFLIQKYLPGRNLAWDSIWHKGRLVTSYCRERLEYPFKHISPSGITGTPSVARTLFDEAVDSLAERAVRAMASKPSGAFSVDVKEDESGKPFITEVDAGKFHSTMPLWGYAAVKNLHLPWYSNLADLYVRLGMGEDVGDDLPRTGLIPAGYFMIRNIDSGVLLWKEDGWKDWVLKA